MRAAVTGAVALAAMALLYDSHRETCAASEREDERAAVEVSNGRRRPLTADEVEELQERHGGEGLITHATPLPGIRRRLVQTHPASCRVVCPRSSGALTSCQAGDILDASVSDSRSQVPNSATAWT